MGKGVSKRQKKFIRKSGQPGFKKGLEKKKIVKAIKRTQASREVSRQENANAAKQVPDKTVQSPTVPNLPSSVDISEFLECRSLFQEAIDVDFESTQYFTDLKVNKHKKINSKLLESLIHGTENDDEHVSIEKLVHEFLELDHNFKNEKDSGCESRLRTYCINHLPHIFTDRLTLLSDPSNSEVTRISKLQHYSRMPKSESWPSLSTTLYRYLMAVIKSTVVCNFTLDCALASQIFPLLIPFPALSKALLLHLYNIISNSSDVNTAKRAIKLTKNLALSQPLPFYHYALKISYKAYRKVSLNLDKSISDSSVVMSALRKGIADIYCHELPASQLHAYLYIRLLASHIEDAEKNDTSALAHVRSWPFLQNILLWLKVVEIGFEPMTSLVAPLGQIVERTVKISPGSPSIPLRLELARAVQTFAARTSTFFPTAWMVLGVFNFDASFLRIGNDHGPETASKIIDTDLPLSNLSTLTREQLHNLNIQKSVLHTAFFILKRECALYYYSLAYPEYTVCLTRSLIDAAAKIEQKFPKLSSMMRSAVDAISKRSNEVMKLRSNVDSNPADVSKFDYLRTDKDPTALERMNSLDW